MIPTRAYVLLVVLLPVVSGCFDDINPTASGCNTSDDCFTGEVCRDGACAVGEADAGPGDVPGDSGGDPDTDIEDVDHRETGDADGGDDVRDAGDVPDGDGGPDTGECPNCASEVFTGPAGDHVCVRMRSGRTRCWGDNFYGQLGDPNRLVRRARPVQVSLPDHEGPLTMSLGDDHTCVSADGEVQCWGGNGFGQLANNGPFRSQPERVAELVNPNGVAAGRLFTCVVDGGGVRCAGRNVQGELGAAVADFPYATAALQPVSLGQATGAIAAGAGFACAVVGDSPDNVVCWGAHDFGQLGVGGDQVPCGDADPCLTPTPVQAGVEEAREVTAGDAHACALSNTGEIQCWGVNDLGQLGIGAAGEPLHPGPLAGTSRVYDSVSAGGDHTCGISAGRLLCWGANGANQAAPAVGDSVPRPVERADLDPRGVAAGGDFTCAIAGDDKSVVCWGDNATYQLGVDHLEQTAVAQQVGLVNADQIEAGRGHACAQNNTGVWCWGSNEVGQLGDGVPLVRPTPFPLEPAHQFEQIAVGARHTCGVRGGEVFCWGWGSGGELGNGSTESSPVPVKVERIENAVEVGLGGGWGCARTEDGKVLCWGYNSCGRVGLEPPRELYTAPGVVITQSATDLAVGVEHACAVVRGAVYCWGLNLSGAVGVAEGETGASCNGEEFIAEQSPVVARDTGIRSESVTAGAAHTCIIDQNAQIWCWGNNDYGQLGVPDAEGTPRRRHLGVVVDLRSDHGPKQVSAGELHTCALTHGGEVYCWGFAGGGRIGNEGLGVLGCEDENCQPTPVRVEALGDQAVSLAVGRANACAVTRDGAVYCWGESSAGQNGDGTFIERLSPVPAIDP
jgi:alpha-tubulin suppressor-like RCC1 family protein